MPILLKLTKALAPKTLRFPGGTVGNFYHWEPGGFFESEMASTLNTKLNARNKRNYARLQKLREGKIVFDDFIQLCNHTEYYACRCRKFVDGVVPKRVQHG